MKIKDVYGKEVKYENGKSITSKQWPSHGGRVKIEVWYDITALLGAIDEGKSEVILQKCSFNCNQNDSWQDHDKKEIIPLGKNKKQWIEFSQNTEPQVAYRIQFKGIKIRSGIGIKHRVSYNVYQENKIYQLTPHYVYSLDKNDLKNEKHAISFTVNSTDQENQDHHYNFEGKLSYVIARKGKELAKGTNQSIDSRNDQRSFKIDHFTDAFLPKEWKKGDAHHETTTIDLNFEGEVDGKSTYYLNRGIEIQRNKYSLEKLTTRERDGKVEVSAQTHLGNGVKDRKWYFELQLKNQNSTIKTPNDEDRSAQTFFTQDDFKGEKKGKIIATYIGKMHQGNKIILYKASKEISVNAPKQRSKDDNDNNNNDQNDNNNNNQTDNDPPKDIEAEISITSKILEGDQVEIKSKLTQVDDLDSGNWTFQFGKEIKEVKDQDGTAKATFSTKEITNDKVEVTVEFKGKDKNNNPIKAKKTQNITIKNHNNNDDNNNNNNNDDKNDNRDDQPPVKEADITITPKVLEGDKVEIQAELKDMDPPKEGTWTFTLAKQTQTIKDGKGTAKAIFSTADIEENEVEVTIAFEGKDEDDNLIKAKKTQNISLKEDANTNENTAPEDPVKEEKIPAPESPNTSNIGGKLPKTATAAPLWFVIGLVMIAGGLTISLFSLRRNRL